MSPDGRSRALVLIPGALGGQLSGPEIRAVRLAEALSTEHKVTLMTIRGEAGEQAGMPVIPFSRPRLIREAHRHDVIMAATLPPFVLAVKRWLGTIAVSDQYDPVDLELGTLGPSGTRARDTAWAARRLQLRSADLVLCAGERQRAAIESDIASHADGQGPPVCIVPFGIDENPATTGGNPIRREFPQIGDEDRIVLWWGSLWRWLDPSTAIRALASIAAEHPEVKLVFTSGPPPDRRNERHAVVEEARTLASELGLLDRNIFFLDKWVPYESRGEYLQDADLGITLHRDLAEAPLAARARYMDYLWAGLPCVLTRGDETAAAFGAGAFAREIEPSSATAVAEAVLGLLEPSANQRARSAGRRLAAEHRWQRVAAPLVEALREIEPQGARSGGVRETASYYARRAVDRFGSRPDPLSAGAGGSRHETSVRAAGS